MNTAPKLTKAERKRAARQNEKKTAETEVPVVPVVAVVPEPETADQSIYRRMAEKIGKLCISRGFTIFGSYVREYMCERPFNGQVSDIDIFSTEHSVEEVREMFQSSGFKCSGGRCRDEKYNISSDTTFKVYHFTLSMINDFFFAGKSLPIELDFVKGDECSGPPFRSLDFACNAWIWDRYGIRLSRQTGTDMDSLCPRDIKHLEMKILEDSKRFVTEYYPMDKEGDILSMDDRYRRKLRLSRLEKMISRGWTIINYPQLKEVTTIPSEKEICLLCQDEVGAKSMKMQCCSAKYHRYCFVSYGRSELSDRTKVRCPQRCSELHF